MCNKIDGRMNSIKTKIKSVDVNEVFNAMGFSKNWLEIKKI